MSDATHYVHHNQPFRFKRGGTLPALSIAYETWGRLNSDHSNAVLILTGLSPGAHAASNDDDPSEGWWEPMLGPGKPIDTNRYFVLCVNSLGSCKGSTGPASENPTTGRPWRLVFPELTVEDIAAGAQLVVNHLNIEKLKAIVGPSMGGMTSLAWLQQNPRGAEHFLMISSASAAEPFAIAIRSLQREAIITDPHWNNGNYDDDNWPVNGMRIARKLGMISYRSAVEWRQRFGRLEQVRVEQRRFGMDYAVESYLEVAAERFIGQFDPACYVYLSQVMDWFDASEGYEDLPSALADIQLESTRSIGVVTDILWPAHQQETLSAAFAKNGTESQYIELPSIQGHDAFLVDYERFCPEVEKFFRSID
jgi:homoserine O-acetyltransferase